MDKENEYVAGKNAAVDDLKNRTKREISIYPSEYYQKGYNDHMAKYKVKEKDIVKGGK